jgi:hypothetical protein
MDTNRFKQLLESVMGDVKPLISEDMTTTKPTVGNTLMIYNSNDVSESFTGDVCRINGNYFYLKSNSSGECAEYLWDASGLKITKVGNTFDIKDPSYNIIKQDCMTACKK